MHTKDAEAEDAGEEAPHVPLGSIFHPFVWDGGLFGILRGQALPQGPSSPVDSHRLV